MFVNINNRNDLIRDCSSGAVLNTNTTEYENYLAKRKRLLLEKQQIKERDAEITNLKAEISELKNLVTSLIESINNKTST
jgi:hypothetical protein